MAPRITICTTPLLSIFFIVLSSLIFSFAEAGVAPPKKTPVSYTNYLKTACSSTTYPPLCIKSLTSYASTIKTNDLSLCNSALAVTLKSINNTYSLVKSLSKRKGLSKREAAVIRDCVEEIGDSIDELKTSLKALGSMKRSSYDLGFQISNVKTWLSAAITDENTCTDGFSGARVSPEVKNLTRKSIQNVVRLTSNALALVNRLNY